jgi:hypothetical protein
MPNLTPTIADRAGITVDSDGAAINKLVAAGYSHDAAKNIVFRYTAATVLADTITPETEQNRAAAQHLANGRH